MIVPATSGERGITYNPLNTDSDGELEYGEWTHMKIPQPLSGIEALTIADALPETVMLAAYQQEYFHFGDERTGFGMLGRQFGKYFFRVSSGDQEPIFCDTSALLRVGEVQPAVRARIKSIQHGELEQFGLGALRNL